MLNEGPDKTGNRQGWTAVIILMIAYTFSFLDRNILTFLVEPMKADMGLTDTEVSLLLGASFGLFYSIMGVPLGRLADLHSRKKIIALGVGLWSLMTALCGLTKSYVQFFFARMGVGVGEATLSPAAYSMLSDYFPKEKLATAISVYSLGIYLGSALAALIGGYAVEHLADASAVILPLFGEIHAWQLIFIFIGLPGLLVALLVMAMKEPVRKGVLTGSTIPLSDVWDYLLENGRKFFLLCGGFAFFYLAIYANSSWLPTFLMRIHGMAPGTVGEAAAVGFGILPAIGVLAGGWFADRLTRRGVVDAKIRWSFWVVLLLIPCYAIFPFMPDGTTVLYALIPFCLLLSSPVAAAAAAVQEIMPNRMRGVASSILILSSNLLGLTIGPTCVALLNDYVFVDEMALGWSLLIISLIAFSIAALFFFIALRQDSHREDDSSFSS
ncbi:MAG: MFS transporter [Bacteroidota bacterium]